MSDSPKESHVIKYSAEWPPIRVGKGWVLRPNWMIELEILQLPKDAKKPIGYRGFEYHFKELVTALLGNPNGVFAFQWNPNAERILKAVVKHKMLAIAGCASSGKSRSLAGIALCHWLINPFNTKVLVTSTTVKTAKGKIWGDIQEAWMAACQEVGGEGILPGRLLTASSQIRYEYNGVKSDKAGIELIPTDANKQKEASEKMQGYKRGNVILLGDEWDTLPPMLLKTARSNLFANPDFRLWGAFNPTGRFTNGGQFAKPKGGWDTIDENSMEWETEQGWCIRFDGLQSPNILAHKVIWTGLFDDAKLSEYKKNLGEDSPGFWIMVRGFFPPTGESTSLYSEAELVKYGCHKTLDKAQGSWESKPEHVAGLDPSWLHGGDRAALVISRCGQAQFNNFDKRTSRKVIEKVRTIVLDREMDRHADKSEEIVRLLKKYMGDFNIPVANLAVDVTGAGTFVTLLNREIGTGWIPVSFAQTPSDVRISKTDKRKANEVYRDKGSELWCVGKELVRSEQIYGLDDDTMEEMCARQYKPGNAEKGVKTAIASKDTMKGFGHRSPDLSDGWFLSLFAARVRCNLSSDEKPKVAAKERAPDHGIYTQIYGQLGLIKTPKRNPFVLEKVPKEAGWDDDNFY